MKVANRCLMTCIAFAAAVTMLCLPKGADSVQKSGKRHKGKKVHHAQAYTPIGTKKVRVLSKTDVQLPKNISLIEPYRLTFYATDFTVTVFSRSFARGEAVLCEVAPSAEAQSSLSVKIAFEGQEVPLVKKTWGYAGIFPIPPDSTNMWMNINAIVQCDTYKEEYHFPLKIKDVQFPEYKRALKLGEYSDADLFEKKPWLKEKIEMEKAKKNKIFAQSSPYRLFPRLSHPRDYHKITSSFYARRLYERYEIVNGKKIIRNSLASPHLGLDLWGPVGAPVFAMADGIVVLAEEMFYEGNQVIVDHGGGIFSRYMHLSKILVRKGDIVNAGRLIGHVGASGMVTGPHLHVGLLIRGVYVDPMSLLCLPLR